MVLSEGFEGAWPQSASSSADPGAWATGVDGVAQEIVGQSGLAWRRDVIYLGSQAVAEIDANGVHELHSDHLGSPRLITKGAGTWASSLLGTAEATQAYGPYGELLSQTGSYLPTTGYTGHLQTDASGLIYMRGRYYSPAWHAFVNSDQGADPGQWNQRAYVGGSPFMGTDPSGMAENRVDCVGGLVTIDGMPNGQRCTGGSTGGGPIIYNDWDWPPDPKISPSTMLLQLLMASSRNININILRVEFYAGGVAPQTPQPKKDCVTRQQILDAAAKWAGTPYGHGQQVQGVCGDCSGTVQAIYGSVGIQIQLGAMPSRSSAQRIFSSPSLSVTTNPQPGDIAYWSKPYNHTMIFSGNDKAWGARKPGQVFGNWPLSWFGNGASPTYLTSPKICDE